MSSIMHNHGYYIPFTKPVPAISGSLTEFPDHILKLNSYSLPYVLGALGVLTRPETYLASSREEIENSVLEGQTLIGNIVSVPVDPVDWYINVAPLGDYGVVFSDLVDPYDSAYRTIASVMSFDDALSGAIGIDCDCHFLIGGATAGGRIYLEVHYAPAAAKVYTLTYDDCDGVPQTDSGFVYDGHHFFDIPSATNLTLNIDAIALATFRITLPNNALCGSI